MKINVIDITLDELENISENLLKQIRASQFEPDVIVYLETGARLLAYHFHQLTGIAAISLTIQRSGSNTKARIARLLALLPRSFQNLLRRIESQMAQRGHAKREITAAPEINLFSKKILILDDAADTGQSLLLARQWAIEKKCAEKDLKLAVITVTQPEAKKIVDFWIYAQLCRFPWSSDSQEREEYLRLYERTDPSKLATGSLRF